MFGIRKTFRRLFGRSAANSFNLMAAYLTNFCADESIDFHRPDSPSAENPPCIGVNKQWLQDAVGEGVDMSSVGANKIVGTDANGEAKAVCSLPVENGSGANATTAYNRVLAVLGNSANVTLQRASLVPLSTGTRTPLEPNSMTQTTKASGTAASWTYDESSPNGFTLPVLTRVIWTGTLLRGVYRIVNFDAYGRAYSVGEEQFYNIDQPTKVTWN